MKRYDFSKLSVLLIDDHKLTKNVLIKTLNAFGFVHIFQANTKESALKIMIEREVDIVISEWGEDTTEFNQIVRMIRRDPQIVNHFIPIIVITQQTEYRLIKEARDAGTSEFLIKPFSAEILLKRIISVIENPREFVIREDFVGPDRRRRRSLDYTGPERRKNNHHSYDGPDRRARSGDRDINNRNFQDKAEEILVKMDENEK
jgi:two-component system chemotaxis response regulator CheY